MPISRKLTRLFSKLQKQKPEPRKLRIDTSRSSSDSSDFSEQSFYIKTPNNITSNNITSNNTTPYNITPYNLSPNNTLTTFSITTPNDTLSPKPSLSRPLSGTLSGFLSKPLSKPLSRPLSTSDIKFIIPPEIFIEICLHLAPQDLYSLSTVCKYFRNILWSTSTATQTIWEKSRIKYSNYLKLPPPFDMSEQEYIWLTLLPKNCQFCSKPYKQYLYDIWPSRVVACESCFRKNTIQTIKDDRPRCIPREIFSCIPYTRFFYYEIFVIYWIPDIELAKEEYNSLDKSKKEEWIKERRGQVKKAKDVLSLYFQQDYQEVYKCGVFNPRRNNNTPEKSFKSYHRITNFQ
ncbi:f-box domain contaning protein [Gigaspora margarita]|uniref:F-box domain contaning protein n=1 Tax=Gigaspora margarita TaxID=4874 RepID=A0A8H3XK89_GIGMA|nr:f-box domain contaning protein [Gigaspora margarita]